MVTATAAPAEKRARFRVSINADWCKSCYICVSLCRKEVFAKSSRLGWHGLPTVEIKNSSDCTGCMECELQCPDMAITMVKAV